jgi:signal transduction histidine kinase
VDITERKRAEHVLELARDQLEKRVEERTRELSQAKAALETDIEERKAAERELKKSYAALQEANAKLASAQDQLLQAEKMASIGQLAAGVAHEINNPIGYVHANLGALERYLTDIFTLIDTMEAGKSREEIHALEQAMDLPFVRQDALALLAESRQGIERVKRIVQDLRDFSHVDESTWQWTDIEHGLESTLNAVASEMAGKAEVVRDYGNIPEIRCLPQQLNEVFRNLLLNAAQAIEGHGVITVRTRSDGDGVRIEVSDSGQGIAPENLKRIFDPFFTTKPVGQGSGLGLSVAYGIMKRHHGWIDAQSEVGKGTTFRLWLPRDGAAAPGRDAAA